MTHTTQRRILTGWTILASAAGLLMAPTPALAQVPTPESVIGWQPGADYKLADYGQITSYFEQLAASSDRMILQRIGKTAEGRDMLLAIISTPENLARLDEWKGIARRLAMARDLSDGEAHQLASDGKAILWIDGGLHASEVAHAQHTPLLAHHLVTSDDAEVQQIREDVITLLMPVMNPDGLETVVDWYRGNVGTAYETAPLPVLYHKYVGHDNNRDWFMLLQPESQAVANQLWHEWFPQIVYNHHQTGPFPSRIFIPPFTDPMNPNIPPMVMRGINLVGSAMSQRFDREGKSGVVSRVQYSVWWNGGMRTAPYFHNQIGILTETNLYRYATPHYYDPAELPETFGGRRGGTLSAKDPSVFYPNPWKGGWWRVGDAVSYMMTGSMAVADIAAELKEDWLYDIYLMGRRAIEAGASGPFAYVIPSDQWDAGEAAELVSVLRRGGIEVHRARDDFRTAGNAYGEGSYVAYAAQPFRAHLVDMMEPQDYPDRRAYPGGPPDPPYDLAGWTLPMQMGVRVDRVEDPFEVRTTLVTPKAVAASGGVRGSGSTFVLSSARNDAARAAFQLLADGLDVARAVEPFEAESARWPAGSYLVQGDRGAVEAAAERFGIEISATEAPQVQTMELRVPRVGLYKSWIANMDEGWTRWVLEQYGVQFDTLHDADIRRGDLSDYDAIVLPDQETQEILLGHTVGTMPEGFTGGLGAEGALALRRFVDAGGTVIALDHASDFAIEQFGLPVRNVVRDVPPEQFFIPGSLIKIDVDSEDPLAFGMQSETAVSFQRSQAFAVIPPAAEGGEAAARDVDIVARYAENDLLMSGWEMGADRYLAGQAAMVRVPSGEGQVVLVGFRPQFRGQPRGTFKLLFNAILAAAAVDREVVFD